MHYGGYRRLGSLYLPAMDPIVHTSAFTCLNVVWFLRTHLGRSLTVQQAYTGTQPEQDKWQEQVVYKEHTSKSSCCRRVKSDRVKF